VSKLNSVIASMATAKFNELIHKYYPNKPLAFFWLAAYTILSRFFDCVRNSISVYIVIRNYLIKIKMIKKKCF